MVKFAKYLSVCVILVSGRNIGAFKLPPQEDCDDYGEQSGQKGLQSSGSAYSSQFMMPDGSVVTDSRGSSFSSDGIKRTFHELKRDADKYVSKANDYVDGLPVPIVPKIPGVPDIPYIPFFSSGQRSSFASSQISKASQSGGSSQFVEEQRYPAVPAGSKVTTLTQRDVSKNVVTSKGSAQYPELVTGEFEEDQNQGASSNAKVNTVLYQPVLPNAEEGYESASSHQQSSKTIRVSGSKVETVLPTSQQIYDYTALPTDGRIKYVHYTYPLYQYGKNGEKVEITSDHLKQTEPLSADNDQYSSSSASTIRQISSYSEKQTNADANIPTYLTNLQPNTFTVNGIDMSKGEEGVRTFITKLAQVPQTVKPETRETHYPPESDDGQQPSTEQYGSRKQVLTSVTEPRTPPHVKFPEGASEKLKSKTTQEFVYSSSAGAGHNKVIVGAPSNEGGTRSRFVIKVQAPTETVGSSSHSHSETSSHTQKVVNVPAGSSYPSATAEEVWIPAEQFVGRENEEIVSASHTKHTDGTSSVPNGRLIPIPHSGDRVDLGHNNGYKVQVSSADSITVPILVGGVPQIVGVSGAPKGSSNLSGSSSSGTSHQTLEKSSQVSHSSGGLHSTNVEVPAGKSFNEHSSSSGSSYYFSSTNGRAGEQLVPNSDIFVRPNQGDENFLQGQAAALFEKHNHLDSNADAALFSGSSLHSFDTPKTNSYGYSTSFSSRSSNINGKKTENREASVTVDDNGKIDKYHVKS